MMAMMTPNNPMALPKISMIKTFNRYKTSLLANVQYPLFIKWGILYGRKGIWNFSLSVEKYRKVPKISPGDYIFERPFLRGLFLEGIIFGGAYLRREICVSESIGPACKGEEIYYFCFVFLCIRWQIPSTSPPGAYIRRGDLTEGFLHHDFGGLIFGGAYTWSGLFWEFYGIFMNEVNKVVKFFNRKHQ